MIKFLLIVFILGYVFFKGLGFFFRVILGGSAVNRNTNETHNQRQPNGGNVKVDYAPKDGSKNSKSDFKGGEYVDFEEVK